MKVYGISYIDDDDYTLDNILHGGDIYGDVYEFASHVEDFLDEYDDIHNLKPQYEYHNKDELVELLEGFEGTTYLYANKVRSMGIVIHIYNLL